MNHKILPLTKSWIKKIIALHNKKYRQKYGLTIIEGEKLFFEAYEHYRNQIEIFIITPPLEDIIDKVMPDFTFYQCSESIMKKISLDKTPSGILAVIKTYTNEEIPETAKKILYLNGISDPGNLGTIIRTAEAFGIDSLLLDSDCVESSNPKCVRAAMGSFFRQNIQEKISIQQLINHIHKQELNAYCLDLKGEKSIWKIHPTENFVLIAGSESHGIEKKLREQFQTIKIPMSGKTESLNVSISCAIALSALTRSKKE